MAEVVSRENVEGWAEDSEKLMLFRRGLEELQKISDVAQGDERGYQWIAGVHGGFGGTPYCQHGNLNFITWHRPYVLDFELKLREQIRRIAGAQKGDEWRLPYWDWAAPDTAGIPPAFTAPTYRFEGTERPNPLFAQPYQLGYPPGDPVPPEATLTFRDPGPLAELERLRETVVDALAEPDFTIFSRAIEGPHNSLHVWAGGFMVTYRSSFDPLFWVHHCNIDRQFWLWQQAHGESSIPARVRSFACQPFKFQSIEAEAFFDVRKLGYTYADARGLVRRDSLTIADTTTPRPIELSFARPGPNAGRVRLHFHGLEHTERTYEIRAFADRSRPPDATTAKTAAEGYVGSYVILGHGVCPGAPGHCDAKAWRAEGLREEHHLAPFDALIDLTRGLQRIQAERKGPAPTGELALALVVVDARGAQVPSSVIVFENMSLTSHSPSTGAAPVGPPAPAAKVRPRSPRTR